MVAPYGITIGSRPNCLRLGAVITNYLKWSDHISAIVSKANRMLGFIKRNCTGDLNKDALKLLYVSKLGYAFQLWAPHSPILMIEVENMQRRATLFICKNIHKERLLKQNLLLLIPTVLYSMEPYF